jgi:hypothetical protein
MDINTYVFDEHFFFEKNNINEEELDNEKIVIEVYDSHHTSRVNYLGIYECDLHYVYKEKSHALHNFWIALANPEADDITKVHGFLKVSMSVLHQDDGRVELSMKASDDPSSICVIPPQIKMEYKQVNIHVNIARNIPDMDYIYSARNKNKAGCDGYVKVEYMGTTLVSKTISMVNSQITWNQTLSIGVLFPVISQKLLLSVWDYDPGKDDLVGCFEIQVNDIFQGKYSNFTSINLYGPPVGTQGAYTNKMERNPEIGSTWRGNILLMIDSATTNNPVKGISDIVDKSILKRAAEVKAKFDWKFDIHYYDLNYLPLGTGGLLTKDDTYGLKIQVGDKNTIIDARVNIL